MWCRNCGQELAEGSCFCIACGAEQSFGQEPEKNETYTNTQEHEKIVNSNQSIPTTKQEQPKGKKKFGFFAIIGITIVGSIFGYIGKMAGRAVVGAVEEQGIEQEIEDFVDFVETYEGGTCTDSRYESEFWGLRFDANDSWMMCTDEERAILSEQIRSSGTAAMEKTAENMDVSEELIDKMKDAFYAETEMAAGYVDYGYLIGEVTMNVMCVYEVTDSNEELLLMEMTTDYIGSQVSDVEYGEQMIGGEKYASVSMTYPVDGGNLVSHVFMRIKDSMVCTITCKYYEGNEQVLESFLVQCSSY